MKNDPASNCEEVGSIIGTPPLASSDMDQYKNDLRNKAQEKGANYVRIDDVLYYQVGGNIGRVSGTAFKCP